MTSHNEQQEKSAERKSPTHQSRINLWRAATLLLIGFFVSGVLGIVRESAIAAQLGTSRAADAFAAAQQLPELIFVLVAGGALGSSFLPIFARYRQQNEKAAWQLASVIMTLTAGMALALSVIVILAAPLFIPLLEPGASSAQRRLTIELTQLMMLTPFIYSISGLLMSVLQSYGRFALPALAIGLKNLGIIFGALGLAKWLPPAVGIAQVGDSNVFGLAWGAVISALLHLALQLPGLRGLGASLRPNFLWQSDGVGRVFRLMWPRVLGLAVVQVNFLVNIALTSYMAAGSRTALTKAFTLLFFIIGIIGQSVGSAVFPTLAATHQAGEVVEFRNRLRQALVGVLMLALPCMVGIWLLGESLLMLLFERGEWSGTSTAATAWALQFFALGLPAFTLLEVLARAFYSIENTRTPVFLGALAMFANIVLNFAFIQLLGDVDSLERGPFAGLALANALATTGEALALGYLLQRRIGEIFNLAFCSDLARIILASLMMMVLVNAIHQGLVEQANIVRIVVSLLGGAIVYFSSAALLGLRELRIPWATHLRQRIRSS